MEASTARKITDFYGPWFPLCAMFDDTGGYRRWSSKKLTRIDASQPLGAESSHWILSANDEEFAIELLNMATEIVSFPMIFQSFAMVISFDPT